VDGFFHPESGPAVLAAGTLATGSTAIMGALDGHRITGDATVLAFEPLEFRRTPALLLAPVGAPVHPDAGSQARSNLFLGSLLQKRFSS
jgi:hypothetical protein